MVVPIKELNGNNIGFEAKGVVTGDDYEKIMIPAIKKVVSKYDKINFLYHIGKEFESYDLKALYNDSKVGFSYLFDFNKIAVVTDKEWVKNLVKAFTPFYPAKIKVFDEEQYHDAIEWLNQQDMTHITVNFLEEDGIVVIEPHKPLSEKDFEYLNSIIDPYLQNHKKLNGVVIKIKQFPGWDSLASIKAHFDFVKKHHEKTKRLAFVTDSSFIELFEHVARFVVHPEVKEFAYDKVEEAIEWIKK